MNGNFDEVRAALALTLLSGFGPTKAASLKERFGTFVEAWKQCERWASIYGISQRMADFARSRLADRRFWQRVEREIRRAREKNVWLLPSTSTDYPTMLSNLGDPPTLLYGRGLSIPTDLPAVAIVGTRRAQQTSKGFARRLGAELARAGVAVVSGLALGIDAAAHQGALDAHGYTVAVLGGGVDRVYPVENHRLYRQIEQAGTVISTYPVGTAPRREHFPARNRIISGLAKIIVVVEAGDRSGALGTAAAGLDQGREVMAVPGDIDRPSAAGSNRLLRDGAHVVTSIEDCLLLAETEFRLGRRPQRDISEKSFAGDPQLQAVYESLRTSPCTIETLASKTGISVQAAAAVVGRLVTDGMVDEITPGCFGCPNESLQRRIGTI